MKKLFGATALAALACLLYYAFLVWERNRALPPPDKATIAKAFENSVQWLENNESGILDYDNPILWRMIQNAGDQSGDERLRRLFALYEKRYLATNFSNVWRPLFYPGRWTPATFEDIAHFPYYNWHFIYAMNCDKELGQRPEVAAQNDPAFCDDHLLRPACATHQLMGILLLRQNGCGEPAQLDATIRQLQARIHRQLRWDIRVVDIYLQRVLMLAMSAPESIKPVWIHTVLEAQHGDGGWDDFDPLIPAGGTRHFGFGPHGFAFAEQRSGFHATAQGVLLLSLLAQDGNH